MNEIVHVLHSIKRSRLLVGLRRASYYEDGIISNRNVAFLGARRFNAAYKAGKETGSWGEQEIRWRAHVACWAADHAAKLPGDFVECGVNKGGLAATVMEYVQFARLPKRFYLIDTFEGLVQEQLTPSERERGIAGYRYESCFDAVRTRFQSYPNVFVVRGAVPEVLRAVNIERVAYLSIDMNCVVPEIAAIEHFWGRLVPGGIALLDDYAFPQHEEQQVQFDAFAEKHGTGVLTLPTGQGILLKA